MDCIFFFFNDTATTEIYTLPLHDALPICRERHPAGGLLALRGAGPVAGGQREHPVPDPGDHRDDAGVPAPEDRKSTRLNSSHANISYAVFCLKKKTKSEVPIALPHLSIAS